MHRISVHLFFSKIDGLSNARSHDWQWYVCCFIRALQTFASQRISSTISSYLTWNGNTTKTKTDISKFISFRFKFFRFRFVYIFRNFFVSVFVSVNGIKIFPLTDISVSVNVNHRKLVVCCGVNCECKLVSNTKCPIMINWLTGTTKFKGMNAQRSVSLGSCRDVTASRYRYELTEIMSSRALNATATTPDVSSEREDEKLTALRW